MALRMWGKQKAYQKAQTGGDPPPNIRPNKDKQQLISDASCRRPPQIPSRPAARHATHRASMSPRRQTGAHHKALKYTQHAVNIQ